MPPGQENVGNVNEQFARDMGEIKGLLRGISDLQATQYEALNRRMNDQHAANTQRLDDINRNVGQRLDDQNNRLQQAKETADEALKRANSAHEKIEGLRGESRKSSVVVGGGAAGLVTITVEFIKRMLSP
jgi:hypothetical protein